MIQDSEWLARCAIKGLESPDPRTKVGCIIVAPDDSVRSDGCNTLPNRIHARLSERLEAPLKYTWVEHAERNAIYKAARLGIAIDGCKLIVELIPCVECARAIIQSGMVEVIINRDRCDSYKGGRYSGEHSTAMSMLAEARICVRFSTLERQFRVR